MTELEKFLEERSRVPIPNGDVARVKLLAKECALGVHRRLWPRSPHSSNDKTLAKYMGSRWIGVWESVEWGRLLGLLQAHGYCEGRKKDYQLTKAAFDLLDETEPYNIFISYKRSESSLLALLVNNTLRLHGLVPFFDMNLKPTDEWHARLEKQVKASQYFVVLLGPNTHCSKYTVREINWAIAHAVPVIQIWSHGYTISPAKWTDTEFPEVASKLERQQAITINTDDAEGYHLAMEKLVNAVGVIV